MSGVICCLDEPKSLWDFPSSQVAASCGRQSEWTFFLNYFLLKHHANEHQKPYAFFYVCGCKTAGSCTLTWLWMSCCVLQSVEVYGVDSESGWELFVTFKFEFVWRAKVVLQDGEFMQRKMLETQHFEATLHFRMKGSHPHLTFRRTPAGWMHSRQWRNAWVISLQSVAVVACASAEGFNFWREKQK